MGDSLVNLTHGNLNTNTSVPRRIQHVGNVAPVKETYILPKTSPRPHAKLHDVPIHSTRITLNPPLRSESIGIVPENSRIKMQNCWIYTYPRIARDIGPADHTSGRGCVTGERDACDRMHADPFFDAGGQVG